MARTLQAKGADLARRYKAVRAGLEAVLAEADFDSGTEDLLERQIANFRQVQAKEGISVLDQIAEKLYYFGQAFNALPPLVNFPFSASLREGAVPLLDAMLIQEEARLNAIRDRHELVRQLRGRDMAKAYFDDGTHSNMRGLGVWYDPTSWFTGVEQTVQTTASAVGTVATASVWIVGLFVAYKIFASRK